MFWSTIMKPFEIIRRFVTDLILYALAIYGLVDLLAASPLVKFSMFG